MKTVASCHPRRRRAVSLGHRNRQGDRQHVEAFFRWRRRRGWFHETTRADGSIEVTAGGRTL